MKGTKFGKLAFGIFGVKPEDVLNGKSPFVALIFSALGFGEKLGLPDTDFTKDLPDNKFTAGLKKTFDDLKKAALKSGYSIDNDEKAKDFKPSEGEEPSYEVYQEAKFLDTVKTGKALDSSKDGIKVEKEFKLGEGNNPKSAKVDLKAGGQITINGAEKAPVELTVNGVKVIADAGKAVILDKTSPNIVSKDGIAELTVAIPVGVVFSNKCKFVSAVAEAVGAAPAK